MGPVIMSVRLGGEFALVASVAEEDPPRITFRVARNGDEGVETSEVVALALLQMTQLKTRGT